MSSQVTKKTYCSFTIINVYLLLFFQCISIWSTITKGLCQLSEGKLVIELSFVVLLTPHFRILTLGSSKIYTSSSFMLCPMIFSFSLNVLPLLNLPHSLCGVVALPCHVGYDGTLGKSSSPYTIMRLYQWRRRESDALSLFPCWLAPALMGDLEKPFMQLKNIVEKHKI